MTPAERKARSDRAWDLALKALVPICFLLGGALVTHEVRLGAMEKGGDVSTEWLKSDLQELKDGQKDIRLRLRQLEIR